MADRLIRDFIASVDRDPDRPAVIDIDSGETTTRADVLEAAVAMAAVIDSEVPEDGVVVLHGPGGGAYWSGLIAILGTGRRLLPIGIETSTEDRKRLASAHGADAVLETDSERAWADAPVPTRRIIEGGGSQAGVGRLDRGGRGSLLLRSSGTTGRPAVALRTAGGLDRVSETLVGVLGLDDEDDVLATIPMQHAYGIEHGVLAPMRSGARVRFRAGFDLTGGADALRDGVTVFPGVPVTLEAATRVGRLDSRLRLAYSAGSPLSPRVRDAFAAAWNCPTGDLYGATEIGTISFDLGGAARPVSGVSMRLASQVDEDAGEMPVVSRHGSGELLVRSDAMFAGYLEARGGRVDPGRRLEDHFRTGDLGCIHPDGRVEITGRAKIQFDVGGLKVNPTEVEAVLSEVPGVREIVVVPMALSETVTRVRAVVVPEVGVEAEDVIEGLRTTSRSRLSLHQRPRVFELVEALPRTATGKLLRGRLIESA